MRAADLRRRLRDARVYVIINAQMPIDAKRAHADLIIDNTGTRAATRRQALALYRRLAVQKPARPSGAGR